MFISSKWNLTIRKNSFGQIASQLQSERLLIRPSVQPWIQHDRRMP